MTFHGLAGTAPGKAGRFPRRENHQAGECRGRAPDSPAAGQQQKRAGEVMLTALALVHRPVQRGLDRMCLVEYLLFAPKVVG